MQAHPLLMPFTPNDLAALAEWAAAHRIGGDSYDFVELGDGRIDIALADVSGKGVARRASLSS